MLTTSRHTRDGRTWSGWFRVFQNVLICHHQGPTRRETTSTLPCLMQNVKNKKQNQLHHRPLTKRPQIQFLFYQKFIKPYICSFLSGFQIWTRNWNRTSTAQMPACAQIDIESQSSCKYAVPKSILLYEKVHEAWDGNHRWISTPTSSFFYQTGPHFDQKLTTFVTILAKNICLCGCRTVLYYFKINISLL